MDADQRGFPHELRVHVDKAGAQTVPSKLLSRAGATPPRHQRRSKSALLISEEIEIFCGNGGGWGVQLRLQFALDHRLNRGKRVPLPATPLAGRPLRLAQARMCARMAGAPRASRR